MFLAVTPSLCLNWGTENKAQFKKYKNQSKMEKTLQWMLQKIRLFLSAHLENRSLKPELDFFSIFLKWSPPPPALLCCLEHWSFAQKPPVDNSYLCHYSRGSNFLLFIIWWFFSSSIHSSMHTSPSIFFLKNSNKPTSCPFQFPPLPRANLQDYRGELEIRVNKTIGPIYRKGIRRGRIRPQLLS